MELLLELSEEVINPTGINKFLWNFPYFGLDRKTFRKLRKIQSKRTEFEMAKAWNIYPELYSLHKTIGIILMTELYWKNDFFFPFDKCNAIFFYPFIDNGTSNALLSIDRVFPGFLIQCGDMLDFYETNTMLTYKELLETIS